METQPHPSHDGSSSSDLVTIHQVLLSPLQVGANLQIRAPPCTEDSYESRNSKQWFIHYLSFSESWYLTRCWFSSQHGLYHQNHSTWILRNLELGHFWDAQCRREICQLESASERLSRELERTLSTQITVPVADTFMKTIDIWILELDYRWYAKTCPGSGINSISRKAVEPMWW